MLTKLYFWYLTSIRKCDLRISALKAISKFGPVLTCGICGNLYKLVSYRVTCEISDSYVSWEHFSGCVAYPIPSPNGDSPEAYYQEGNRWKGENRSLRMDLIDHAIKYYEREMQMTPKTQGVDYE